MNAESDRLEHLFARCLDGEASPAEHALLESLAARDPQVRSAYEDYCALDRQLGQALRDAVRTQTKPCLLRAPWTRVGKGLVVAVAACLATFAWLRPAPPRPDPRSARPPAQQAGSWFAPPAPVADVVETVPTAYERPELRLRGTQRQWIVIPGREPGTFRIIQVDRVRTHVIGVHRDF